MSYVDRAIWLVDDDELQELALKELFAMRDELALLRAVCGDRAKLMTDADFAEALNEPEEPLAEQIEREIEADSQWLTDSAYGQANLEANVNEA